MNIRYLKSFCAVAELGSLAAAARQIGLANASLAEQIRALEHDLKARLVTRRGQGVALTPAGLAILDRAREVVKSAESLHHLAQLGRPSGRLRVGAISTALMAILPAALQRLSEQHPEIELAVVPGTSVGLFQMLERDEIDCALAVRPPFAIPKGLTWRPVREEPLVLVAPEDLPGHGLHQLLSTAPLIRMDRKAWTGQVIDRFLTDHGLSARELFELDAPEAIVILVAQGMGVSLLPNWGISAPSGRAIRIIPIDDPRYSRSIGILSRRGPASALVDAFAETVSSGSATAISSSAASR